MAPRLAVIGYGYAGRSFHSYLVGITPGLALAGVCVRDPERRAQAARERGCRTWERYDDVLADRSVDGVVLATPTSLHVEQALAALAAGKHVVVDKPVCLDPADLDRLAAAERASGRSLITFHNRRWDGDFLTVRRLLDAGTIGRPRVIEMAWGGFGGARGWRATVAGGGGRTYDLGAHMVDQLCQLVPAAPVSVSCTMQHDLPGQEVESHAHLMIRFADGTIGVIEASYISSLPRPRFRLLGTAGGFEKHGVDPQEAAMIAGDIDAAREDPDRYGTLVVGQARSRVPTVPGRWRSFYEGVRDHLCGQAPNPVPLDSVRRPVAVIAAAFRSAAGGRSEILNGSPAPPPSGR
jgi:predicted dehydrogenase